MMSNVLVFVEQVEGKPKKTTLPGITFGQQVAKAGGGALHLLLVGPGAQSAAEAVRGFGAQKVLVAEGPALANYLVEAYAAVLLAAQKATSAGVIAGASSSTVKDLLPRVAARLDAGMASEVLEVIDATTFKRPMWAGNVIATVQLTTPVRVCSVRGTEFAPPNGAAGQSVVERLEVSVDLATLRTKFVSVKPIKSERPELTSADRIVSGGRGAKGADGFKVIERLADALHAAVGASRAACDAGWVPNDLQVGQTGKVVAPDLYVAVGISGAIQHVAGMKSAKTIVAINKDPEAPIFQVADYGLVADLFEAVPQFIEEIKKL
jgi:electron transfer flavoprotein alpha subunit